MIACSPHLAWTLHTLVNQINGLPAIACPSLTVLTVLFWDTVSEELLAFCPGCGPCECNLQFPRGAARRFSDSAVCQRKTPIALFYPAVL